MKVMECVRFEPKFDDYLKRLLKEAGHQFVPKEWGQSYDEHNPIIIMLDQDHIEQCKQLLINRNQKVVIAVNARRDFKLINDLKHELAKIFGFIDLTQEIEYNLPLLKNYSVMTGDTTSAENLNKLAGDMDKILEFTKSELSRVKDLHDRLVKMRVDNLKGVSITSKFMAGEKSGGEFLDMLQTDHELLFLIAGTNSYVVSSFILAEMEILKMSTPTTGLKSQCENFEKMINHHASENGSDIHYCLLHIDLKTLQAEILSKGDGYIIHDEETHKLEPKITMKLKPGEKVYLLSQGALKNMRELNPQLSITKFFKAHADKNTRDLTNEYFFELSRNKTGQFLNCDAIMAAIEIEAKTLYQI